MEAMLVGTMWKLLDQDYRMVVHVRLPADVPDVVMYKGRTFYYNNPEGEFVETHVHVIE